MPYQRELRFMKDIFAKCRLQLRLIDPANPSEQDPDAELRRKLGMGDLYSQMTGRLVRIIEGNTIYRMIDPFGCRYLVFLLPDKELLALAGPYLSVELSQEQMLERAEQRGVNPQWFRLIEKYFAGIPVLNDDSPIFAALDSFAELIWGQDNFTMVDLSADHLELPVSLEGAPPEPVETVWMMEELERRYAIENEMLQAVAQGQFHKAELLMAGLTQRSFERRLADPVRNLKNYCIIMNTLLRKAAEHGGVHPLYLDRLSSDFARRIENLSSVDTVQELMDEMFRGYCRQVNKNTMGQYSPPVQKALIHIDVNLSGELNLKVLAGMQNINASYLSALFKKETGMTLTDHINQKRMQQAARLLVTTRLQIQTVALHCGISDVNYFSKLFKKYIGQTPNEYRKTNQMGKLK